MLRLPGSDNPGLGTARGAIMMRSDYLSVDLQTAVPTAADQGFDQISANEWLLTHAPYTKGDIAFSAATATKPVAQRLGTDPGTAIFVIDRTTWDRDAAITTVRLSYGPGYRIHTTIGGAV